MAEITVAKQGELAERHDKPNDIYVAPILSASADLANPANVVPRGDLNVPKDGGRPGMSNENQRNIANAVNNALYNDRNSFTRGFELTKDNIEPRTDQQRAAVEFYRRTTKAFESWGNPGLQAQFERELTRFISEHRRRGWAT